jgi:diphosphomevalonate decarboxylase
VKASAVACANQGLIKYWGKTDEALRVPSNASISVCLAALTTRTTVEFSATYDRDSFSIGGRPADDSRVVRHLDRIRALAGTSQRARVASENGFPPGVGFASSASGFAALTVAGTAAAGLSMSVEELSRLARLGSGSASRSIPGGFSELLAGDDRGSVAVCLAGAEQLDFRTVAVSVGSSPKKVSSSEGMRITTATSPFFSARLNYLGPALERMRAALRARDASEVARLAEVDTLNMHATMLTSDPPLVYWSSGTMDVMRTVLELRTEGIPAFFSIDAGENVFVNCRSRDVAAVTTRLAALPSVTGTLPSVPGGAARRTEDHLF